MMIDMVEGELGAFLRSRREATSPESVGLVAGPRRRTPGLRRSELATLAGVSVDYLIRIEQGRDRNPSAQVLAALANALDLGEDDRTRLRVLATVTHSPELCPSAPPTARTIRPTVQALLDQLEPTPAVVVNHLTDVLAWTDGYERLARPLGMLDGDPPNLVTHVFTDERARTAYPDWADVAGELAASLQSEQCHEGSAANELATHLADVAGEAFTSVWERAAITERKTGVRAIAHPDVGVLRLAYETLDLPDAARQKVIIHLPADEASATGLDRLAGRAPGRLRAVSPA